MWRWVLSINGASSCCDLALPQLLHRVPSPLWVLRKKGQKPTHGRLQRDCDSSTAEEACPPNPRSHGPGLRSERRGQNWGQQERHSAGGTALTGREGHVTQALHLQGGRRAVIFEKGRQIEKLFSVPSFLLFCPDNEWLRWTFRISQMTTEAKNKWHHSSPWVCVCALLVFEASGNLCLIPKKWHFQMSEMPQECYLPSRIKTTYPLVQDIYAELIFHMPIYVF